MDETSLYCKMFVDTEIEKPQLKEIIRNLMAGTYRFGTIVSTHCEIDVVCRLGTIVSTHCEIDVEENDDFDAQKRLDPNDGFLYYRYYLDIDPVEGADRQEYVTAVAQLLMRLWQLGFKAVAACDFEDELPKPK
jgi:hypothetical protein